MDLQQEIYKNKILKYGSLSALYTHIDYTIDEDLSFLSDEVRNQHKEKLKEMIGKFLIDNKINPHPSHI